jgi:DNA transformation protein
MAYSEDYLNFLIDQLSEFGAFDHKKMFGGVGFFKDGKMFAGIMYGNFCLKVGDSNRKDFEDRGMKPFVNDSKKKGMPYWEVPAEILEDKTLLKQWAEKAYQEAIKGKK